MGKSKKTEKSEKSVKTEKNEISNTGGDEDVSMVLNDEDEYEVKASRVVKFAFPLASKKMNKKILKTVKKAAKAKHLKRGVKEVVKALRKGEKGLVIIAGDISPIDIVSHIPVLCEDNKIPYIFVPSKEDLGNAGVTKRPTSVVMIIPGGKTKSIANKDKEISNKEVASAISEYKEGYDDVVKEIGKLIKVV